MIGAVSGTVVGITAETITVLTESGVGYDVRYPADEHFRKVTVFLHIWHVINDNGSVLFGFGEHEDKELAQLIEKTQGIGPVVAHRIVVTLGRVAIVKAINNNDPAAIAKVRGISKEKAKLVIDTVSKDTRFKGVFVDERLVEARDIIASLGGEPDKAEQFLVDAVRFDKTSTAPQLAQRAMTHLRNVG